MKTRLLLTLLAAALLVPASALAAPPANDSFDSAVTLNSGVGVAGTNVDATFEAGEPENSGVAANKTVWYRWTALFSGQIYVDACQKSFFLNLAVYRGTNLSQLDGINSGNVACGATHAKTVPMDVEAGQTYYVQVDGITGFGEAQEQGTFTIRLDFYPRPANDDFANAAVLGPSPNPGTNLGASVEPGEPPNSGVAGDHTVWYRWTAPDDGQLVVDACQKDFFLNLAVFRGSTLAGLSEVDSGNIACGATHAKTIPMDVQEDVTYHVQVDGVENGSGSPVGTFSIFATFDSNVDNVDPVVTISSGPDGPTAARRPAFGFSAHETVQSFRCGIEGVVGPITCTSGWQVPSDLPDGDYTFRVEATDASDNTGAATRTFSVDATAPETAITAGPGATTTDTTPTFAFAASETAAPFRCRVDAGPWRQCGSPVTTAALAVGGHRFAVAARDALGNEDPTPATRAFTVVRPPSLRPDTAVAVRPVLRSLVRLAAKRLRKLGTARLRKRGGLRMVRVKAPAPGTIRLTATRGKVTVLRGSAVYTRAGRRTLRLRLTAKGRRLLRRRPRARVVLRASFVDARGVRVATARRKVTLRRR